MKLDKIKFAEIISWFGHRMKSCMTADEIRWLDKHIDIDVEPVATQYVDAEQINGLLQQIDSPTGFINAIKAYRSLTGCGLKESKEAIERYRRVSNQP